MTKFPWAGIGLLHDLRANNTREWFKEHQAAISEHVLLPGQAIVAELASFLASELDRPVATKSFRLPRDVRFSKDKTPYDTHFRFAMWPEDEAHETAAVLYFSIEPDHYVVGTGLWEFGTRLEAFRARVDELEPLLPPNFRLSDPELKRIPAGFAPDSPHADHFRRKSLTLWRDIAWSPEGQDQAISTDEVQALLPIRHWLAELPYTS